MNFNSSSIQDRVDAALADVISSIHQDNDIVQKARELATTIYLDTDVCKDDDENDDQIQETPEHDHQDLQIKARHLFEHLQSQLHQKEDDKKKILETVKEGALDIGKVANHAQDNLKILEKDLLNEQDKIKVFTDTKLKQNNAIKDLKAMSQKKIDKLKGQQKAKEWERNNPQLAQATKELLDGIFGNIKDAFKGQPSVHQKEPAPVVHTLPPLDITPIKEMANTVGGLHEVAETFNKQMQKEQKQIADEEARLPQIIRGKLAKGALAVGLTAATGGMGAVVEGAEAAAVEATTAASGGMGTVVEGAGVKAAEAITAIPEAIPTIPGS